MVLVTKQMYPRSLERGQNRRTDYRYSHPAGESEGSCPMNVCVPTRVILFGGSYTGGRGRSARFP